MYHTHIYGIYVHMYIHMRCSFGVCRYVRMYIQICTVSTYAHTYKQYKLFTIHYTN